MAKVLFNWNAFPSSRLDQSKTGQLACSYRPLATESQVLIDTILTDLYKCQNLKCGGIINKYCTANKDLNSWTCCFCDSVNRLPAEFDPILTGNDVQLVQRFQNAAVPQNLKKKPFKNSNFCNRSCYIASRARLLKNYFALSNASFPSRDCIFRHHV